jgi:hypothetical protein
MVPRFRCRIERSPDQAHPGTAMLLLVYYLVAITILVLHFTGWLRYHNLEWLVLVLAVTVFPAVLYL